MVARCTKMYIIKCPIERLGSILCFQNICANKAEMVARANTTSSKIFWICTPLLFAYCLIAYHFPGIL